MRIISGEYRGRQLKTTVGPGYRPAMAKVRGALFSMLESRGVIWPETRVLDLFAGSGSLGFEALSRGAKEVAFVESLPRAAALIRENAAKLGVDPARFHVYSEEAGKILGQRPFAPYDVIFIDPPYGKNLMSPSIKALIRNGWMAKNGILNAEIEGTLKFDPEKEHPALEVAVDRKYGQTRLVLWNMKTQEAQFTPAPLTL
ncbi:16S rRNA (guanine(966)-N(2))-methyltransferase RsmD [Desulfovibrio sp. OttesenSCG-928-F07]|nr:16S rRNA (guanine(966)-N(2))-methyltransferase RsmD [Desulfovibrio sp. OttesenSCG-928-F07]